MLSAPPILMWSYFMAYKGKVKEMLGRALGCSVITPTIVGLKIGSHKTWVKKCVFLHHHTTHVLYNVATKAIQMMFPKLQQTYYKFL
jgi:hypothetical protein